MAGKIWVLGMLALGSAAGSQNSGVWTPDMGNGRYRNPVLVGDYSDPDAVRVGEDFYLTASSFANVPGLPILHSRDLVNWSIIGHALKANVPAAHFATPRRGGGVWAPAIRHHDGKFMVYYPDPDRGIQLVTATDPRGPWSAPILVWEGKGIIDPAPFWDDDGTGWLVVGWARSRAGVSNIVTLKRLSADGTKVEGEGRGTVVIDGAKLPPVRTSIGMLPWTTVEGPKLYKRGGWYYIFAPAGGVKQGWQGVFRSRKIDGPYEARNVMDQGKTAINGPHQGAWLTTPKGEDWFVHFQDRDAFGRQVLLQPMRWGKDGWPVIGIDKDGDGRGEPVTEYRKPAVATQPVSVPATGDDFERGLSLAWQWNANPREDWASLTDAPGMLRLKSISTSASLYEAGNVLTQKLPAERFTVTAKMVFAPKAVGEAAGLTMFGMDYGWIGVVNAADGAKLVQRVNQGAPTGGIEREVASIAAPAGPIWLRLSAAPESVPIPVVDDAGPWPIMRQELRVRVTMSYSVDGTRFMPFGEPFLGRQGRWVGAQIGLFARATSGTPAFIANSLGHADFDDFAIGAADRGPSGQAGKR